MIVDDRSFVTDNWNVIIDLRIEPIADAPALERAIRAIPGVVDTGLFLGTADAVLVADGETVTERTRPGRSEGQGSGVRRASGD